MDCEHVYQVGDAGILVHNACSVQLQKARGYIPSEFDIVRYNQKATWQKLGSEKHHGVLDEWMKVNVKGYSSGRAPTIVLSVANHNATRAAFNRWRAANGWSKLPVPWQDISPRQIQSLMNHFLTEAKVPREAAESYLLELNQYLYRYM